MLHSVAFKLFASSSFLFSTGVALLIILVLIDFKKEDMNFPIALFLGVTFYIAPFVAIASLIWFIWTY